jgi:hypothetical protein
MKISQKLKRTRDPARLSLTLLPRSRSGQEEMVGFVVIIVIVAVVLLVLLGFMLKSPSKSAVESYEVENFIQSSLQYTSECENMIEFLSVQDLIVSCERGETCLGGENSCELLNETIKNLVEKAWEISEQSAVKGYKFSVMVEEEERISLKKGNETSNYKGGWEDFSKRGDEYIVSLDVYY